VKRINLLGKNFVVLKASGWCQAVRVLEKAPANPQMRNRRRKMNEGLNESILH
jgi:hypothetical protein